MTEGAGEGHYTFTGTYTIPSAPNGTGTWTITSSQGTANTYTMNVTHQGYYTVDLATNTTLNVANTYGSYGNPRAREGFVDEEIRRRWLEGGVGWADDEERRRHRDEGRTRDADQRAEAIERATALLMEFLNDEQREEYRRDRIFHVVGSLGTRYSIGPGTVGNVDWYTPDGVRGGRLCAHPTMREEWLPDQDVALAQLLALTTDEAEWLRHANVLEGRRPGEATRNGVPLRQAYVDFPPVIDVLNIFNRRVD